MGDEASTTPDPFAGSGPGSVPVPDAGPVPPPWTTPPATPPGWDAPPSPPGGDGERTISLSDEPWEHEQWAEEVWSPGPTPKKQALPYVLIGGGLVVLMLVAAAIIFWPSGSDPAAGPAAGGSSAEAGGSSDPSDPSPGPDEEPTTASGGDLNKQAGQVDALLTEMASTRSELGTAVTAGCRTADLQRIYDQRQEQLRKARALDVSALESGTELRDALVRALTASSSSNKTYLDMSPGCPSDNTVASVNGEASAAKRDFIGYWRPNAEKAGLDVRSADTI
ncbi:hypothetical protein [Spirillospora sp. NPDC029432]|uniref:hypothetical protein n=1 Tax=Spirillospora sp. NPDC029432 TaxID=3154599 RepID=UPI003453308D